MNINRFTSPLWDIDTFFVFDDFEKDQSDLWAIDTITDSGSVAIGDAANGIATLTPSDGTVADNDEVYLATPNELFLIAANRSLYARARLKFVETASGVYNAAFGFASAVAANLIVDDGAGMRASGNIVCLEKRDGETVWRLTTRNGSAATSTASTRTAGGSSYQKLEIFVKDYDGTNVWVSAKVDDEYLRDSNNLVIRHALAVASSTEMQLFAGAKLGAITNNDTLLLDYWYGAQTR